MTNPLNPKPRSHQEPYECGCPNKAKKEGETRENPRRRRGIERYGRIMGRKDEGNTKGPGTRGAKNNQSQLKPTILPRIKNRTDYEIRPRYGKAKNQRKPKGEGEERGRGFKNQTKTIVARRTTEIATVASV